MNDAPCNMCGRVLDWDMHLDDPEFPGYCEICRKIIYLGEVVGEGNEIPDDMIARISGLGNSTTRRKFLDSLV